MLGDDKSAAPFRDKVKQLELLNSLIQRAANPTEYGKPELIRELGAACAGLGRDAEARAWYKLAIATDPLDTVSQQALYRLAPGPGRHPRPPESPRG